jgi:Ca-activated chloride channel family protein
MPLPETRAERIADMAKHDSTTLVSATARWDRPAVPTGNGETYLVVTITTGRPSERTRRPAVDVAFVIDRSGSMSGAPLALAKQGVLTALDLLKDDDGMSVVAYDDTPRTVCSLMPATAAHCQGLAQTLRQMETGGSTNLFGGWQLGCDHLTHPEFGTPGRLRRAILLTDGLANVGVVDPQQISWQVTRQRQAGVTTSTLGLGGGVDEALLSGMAEAGGGNFAFVEHPKDLPDFFARELGEALSVVAARATLTLTLPEGVRGRLLNPFPAERTGKRISVALGELPAGLTLPLVFSITTRAKKEGIVYPPLELTAEWRATEPGAATARIQVPIDPLMVVSPADFESMPHDEAAVEAVAQVIADDARRTALRHYRTGDVAAARFSLGSAMTYSVAAPVSSDRLRRELDEVMQFDPNTPEFAARSKQIENDTHRRSRGRNQ